MNSPSAHVKLVWILGTSNPSCGTVPTPPLFALILHRGAEPHVVQESLASLELEAVGLPSHLAMRLGAHVGPVFPTDDPVIGRLSFMGSHGSLHMYRLHRAA